jgi:SAM-dependent methyltransferase
MTKCRHCQSLLKYTFLDLGHAPPSNSYLNKKDLSYPEVYLPLKIKVCNKCWLVQTEDHTSSIEIFKDDYAYFSSASSSYLLHAKNFSNKIIKELDLNKESYVIEIASNDGYLLKNFVKKKIPCLGIEPTKSTAEVASKFKIPVIRKFFDKSLAKKLAKEGKKADLIIGNNVYAHVPDINNFTRGLKSILKDNGTISLEFPHLLNLIKYTQFDTIYHEHFSYLSLNNVKHIFSSVGLRILHVEEIATHGGSLRVYGCHHNDKRKTTKNVNKLLKKETARGLQKLETYMGFKDKVNKIKDDLILFLIKQKRLGNKVIAYGAAAKGNTLLNYIGLKKDYIEFVADKLKYKQGKFLPASHIPITNEKMIKKLKPKYVLIFPWNIKKEIIDQLSYIKNWNGKFLTVIPKLKIL